MLEELLDVLLDQLVLATAWGSAAASWRELLRIVGAAVAKVDASDDGYLLDPEVPIRIE